MRKPMRERINVNKVSRYAVIMNALQILFATGILAYALLMPNFSLNSLAEKTVVGIMTGFVIWGAALDIREAFSARKVARQSQMLEDAMEQLETLNGTLRAQRHDFKNHLQVVYSLMEMEEYAEAQKYIEQVYDSIQQVGRTLKTAIPAVNALLAAKEASCAEKGVKLELEFNSNWQNISMPGWELCRVLGNLIDNATDALTGVGTPSPVIRVEVGENVQAYTFTVADNGPGVAPELRESIFEMGFTTKGGGHGMGLHIVRELMREYAGSIRLECKGGETRFIGSLPKTKSLETEEAQRS